MLTPFPHTPARAELAAQGRILTDDWDAYTADRVVFQPKEMSADRLAALLDYAWETFYREEPQRLKMFKLLQEVARREAADGTHRPRDRRLAKMAFGRPV